MTLDGAARFVQFRRMSIDAHSVVEYERVLQRYFARWASEYQEVPDLVQETFVRMLASERASELQNPAGYLVRIGRNLMTDISRRRSPLRGAGPIGDGHLAAVAPSQEHDLHHSDLQQAFEAALAELPKLCQQVFTMRRFDEMNTSQVADTLSISPRMVQKYMVRAMSHLHRRLRPFMPNGRQSGHNA